MNSCHTYCSLNPVVKFPRQFFSWSLVMYCCLSSKESLLGIALGRYTLLCAWLYCIFSYLEIRYINSYTALQFCKLHANSWWSCKHLVIFCRLKKKCQPFSYDLLHFLLLVSLNPVVVTTRNYVLRSSF